MFGIHNLTLFIISGLLLNIAPGPDSILIMTRSATQGWRAGSVAAFGIGTGTLVHIAAAAFGLSALLAASATGFLIVKMTGAAYLLYIGVSMLLARKKPQVATTVFDSAATVAPLGYRKIYLQGFLTNVLNPKVGIFFLAFVPQFISADADNKALAFIVLGLIFNVNGMLWCNFLAVFTAAASRSFKVGNGMTLWLNRLIGALFVSFGLKLALDR
jgi:threonine/homoserine/homoserine lactone efflux protein